jgi:ribosomal protein S18 acetylase RimI-like enzyme
LNDFKFYRFEEIDDFPLHFSPFGDTLYVIFVAVHPDWRGKHLGLALVKSIVEFARRYGVSHVKLVAKDNRIGLYQKCDFDYIKELPDFLEGIQGKNIVMKNNLKS